MNRFKQGLAEGRQLLGLWQALAAPYTAEICAGAGYDWLLFDGEHAPNTLQTLLGQLQAVSAYPVSPVARVPVGDPSIIKQYLDIGCTTLLVPMVETAEQARRLVAATRFPPYGVRGVASSTSRASRFGADANYVKTAHETVCMLVQIESATALGAIEEIAAVEGVDGLFIGPADLAASLGHLDDPRHPDVQAAIDDRYRPDPGERQVGGQVGGHFRPRPGRRQGAPGVRGRLRLPGHRYRLAGGRGRRLLADCLQGA